MNVAIAQYEIFWEDIKNNLSLVKNYAEEAKDKGADILVLPEMFSTGFSMNTNITGEPDGICATDFLKKISLENKIAVIAGVVKKNTDGKYENTAIAINEKGVIIFEYSKMHLFSYAEEDRFYSSGDVVKVFDYNGFRISTFICYDLRFPEIFRLIAKNVDAVIVIANWPASRSDHWKTLLKARAIENQVYVIGCNAYGNFGGLSFDGGSSIIDPFGRIIAENYESEGLVFGTVNIDDVFNIRNKYPFLEDIKMDYTGLK